ncbi:DUF4097 family beta strand repeat-containing protein [Terrimonas alba]|uniref:DUF4097 family beta strand repeat-containing protein n=1 Tax=Terrimonas alba TaxID=3349636 RepID=UPI0035F49F7A
MKKTFFFLMLASLAVSVNAQFNAEKTPVIIKSLSSENIKNILSETSGGNISVAGVNASEARIEVYAVPNNYKKNNLSESEIKEKIEADYRLTIDVSNNKLTATAKPKDKKMDWRKALSFSFKIYVPGNVAANLSTSGGNIDLTNLTGDQKFSTSGGNLNIDNVDGKLDGRTSGGNIYLKDSKSNDAELTTSGGDINAKNCDGKLRLTTSGGSLHLKDLKGDIKAITSGGNVEGSNVSGELVTHTSGGNIHLEALFCSLETSTSGGNIDVAMNEPGKYVRISNSGGNIDLELPKSKGLELELSADKVKTDKLENFNGKIEDDKVEGKLNGGGSLVKVNAGSGRIYLKLK